MLIETFSNYLVLMKKIFEFIIYPLFKITYKLSVVFIVFVVLAYVTNWTVDYVINYPNCVTGDCENGNGKIYYWDNGSNYTGEFENGKPHGLGTLVTGNMDKYYGNFRYGKYDGVGNLEFHSTNNKKLKYIGEFTEGKRNGRGILTDSYGNKYDGCFKDGFIHGEGTFYFSNGEIKYGRWTCYEPDSVTPKSSN